VSADNRYKLFVNGKFVSLGLHGRHLPLEFWNGWYCSLFTKREECSCCHCLELWWYAPGSSNFYQTGFILQGNSETEKMVNTDKTWKCRRDNSYNAKEPALIYTYYVAGPEKPSILICH
jgi:hypothetical protein